MMSPDFRSLVLSATLSGTLLLSGGVSAATVSGQVFHDQNGNGTLDPSEPGVAQVGVSNGTAVVATDASGRYTLDMGDEGIVFVIKPSQWQVALDPKTSLPRNFYVHRPTGSPESKFPGIAPTGALPEAINFPLTPQAESGPFDVVCFGDTQPRNQQEVDFISHDVLEELIGIDAAFGFTLGDLVFDNLAMQPELAQSVGLLGMPWHHVIGNHDINFDTPDYAHEAETYTRVFGPPYYSFNHGKVHFLVLNDIYWEVENRRYHAELGAAQLAFIEADLALVPKDHLVVAMMHIPVTELVDRAQFFNLLKPFPKTFTIAAHWHRQKHFFLGEDEDWLREDKHHHLVQGTACGAWWTGSFDEMGIPHTTMSDGTPNGYAIITFDEADYRIRYKAARRPADYQLHIAAPESVTPDQSGNTEIVANIFAGSERSTARMRIQGEDRWIPMTRFDGTDPFVVAAHEREMALAAEFARLDGVEAPDTKALKKSYNERAHLVGRSTPGPRDTDHLWKATLPADMAVGYHIIEVETTDMFEQVYRAHRIIRVVAPS